MIEIKNLTKYFYSHGEKPFLAVKNIDLLVDKGDIVCIVGPSGSGKTTLLKCLAGLDKKFEGKIKIKNKKNSDYLKNNRIALVSQRYSNFPWLTVFENIAIGFYDKNKTELEIVDLTNKLLRRVGLSKVRNHYPNKLSGGMQQRVAIARAIAQDTDIIAFDEPFGALDVQTRSQMQEFLAKLWEEEKKTMILVTHDIDEAIYLANKIYVLGTNPGTIKEIVKVNIRRPRKSEIRFQNEFIKLKKFISYIIRSESIKANMAEGVLANNDSFKMGLYIWPGNTPLYYAKDSGLFLENYLDIEQINFEDNTEKIDLWSKDKLDAINITLDTAIQLYSKSHNFKIVSVLNRSIGGDALITRSDIKRIDDLIDKTIGLEINSAGHFLFLYILNKAGLTTKDVKIKNMSCGDIGAAIIAGKIDAGILWEPWLSKALELSNFNILKSTNNYPVLYDVLIVHNKILKQKKDELQKIDKVWKQSIKILKEQKSEMINVASSHIGIAERELAEHLNKIQFFNKTPDNIFNLIKDIQQILLKEKIINKSFKPENLFKK